MTDTAEIDRRTGLATPTELTTKLIDRWGWFVGLGLLLVVLGTVGLGMTGVLTIVTVIWFGLLLVVGGVAQLIHAFRCQGWRSTLANGAIAVLYLAAGVVLLIDPVMASASLTLVLGALILAAGAVRIGIAVQHWRDPGWVWLLVSGGVGVVLGLVILSALHEGALWIIGLMIAIELIMDGWGMVIMGLALRRWGKLEETLTS
ncbi:MAG: DUF308 domain-containing protein [Pseudomonadota bacterium]